MGGEKCGVNDEYTNCSNTIVEMERFHWTYLNDYYHPDVISDWISEGCYGEIEKRMGYRISLVQEYLPIYALYVSIVNVSITLRNDEFSAPVHKQKAKLIFRNNNLLTFEVPIYIDLRYLFSGQICSYNFQFVLTIFWTGGEFRMFLEFSDNSLEFTDNKDYNL